MKKINDMIEETETTITINGNLELTEDYKTKKHLVVRGNILGEGGKKWDINARDINAWDIDAGDIDAWDINAGDIDARDIVCVSRKKKHPKAKTIAYSIVLDRFNRQRKEVMPTTRRGEEK